MFEALGSLSSLVHASGPEAMHNLGNLRNRCRRARPLIDLLIRAQPIIEQAQKAVRRKLSR